MRRVLTVFMLASGLAAGAARAQVTLTFGQPTDTAVAALPGAMAAVDVQVSNLPYNFSNCYYQLVPPGNYSYLYSVYCLTYARVTIGFDPTKVDSISVESVNASMTVSGSSPGAGRYSVTASGLLGGIEVSPFRLHVRLAAGVTDGAYLWMHADSLTTAGWSLTTGASSRIATLCHASHIYGDVDGNGQVDSRDALITLSAAVGLPVGGGFDLANGDVDGDGLTNSRDALMMLSYAIGLAPYSSGPLNRVGAGIPDACPGLTPPGETVVFNRNVGGSGGIFRLDSLSTAPVQLTALLGDRWPRLNAAGTAMVFTCVDGSGYIQICRADQAGSNRTMLTGPDYPTNAFPDWTPDGSHIGFLRGYPNYYIVTMDSVGANLVPTWSTGIYASSVGWSRNDSVYAFSEPSHYGLHTAPIDSQPSLTPLDANYGYVTYAAPLRWSPDGTVLATVNYSNGGGGILTMPAVGGTAVPALAPDGIKSFDWGPQGVIFSLPDAHGSLSLWLLQGGFGGPVVRLTNPGFGSGQADDQASFRRNP